MSSRFEQSVALYRKKVLQGAALADVISDLHGEGLSILEAIRVIQSVYDISRNEAEDSVLRQPAWAKEAKSVWRASDFLGIPGLSDIVGPKASTTGILATTYDPQDYTDGADVLAFSKQASVPLILNVVGFAPADIIGFGVVLGLWS